MAYTIRPFPQWLVLLLLVLLNSTGLPQNSDTSSDTPLESLGPKPDEEEDLRSVYLRGTSAILSPGTWDLEVGLQYRRAKTEATLSDSDLTRQVRLPMTARFGIHQGWEGMVSVPLIYSYAETSESGVYNSDDATGLGDVTAGLTFQIAQEKTSWPEMLGTVQVRAPSGRDPYDDDETEASLGSGHWAVSAGLHGVRVIDPLVLFGSIGYVHQFSRHSEGLKYQPGPGVQYSMGLGFSVNDDVSLSARFAGLFQDNWEIDGADVEGSSYEPMTVRMAATMRYRRNMYLEPAVAFGLNDDAPDVYVGAALVMRMP